MSEELPKQIWAWKQSFITRWSSIGAGTDTVKYIREDIHAARVKELEAVVNKLWRRQDSLDTFDAAVNAVLAPLFEKQTHLGTET